MTKDEKFNAWHIELALLYRKAFKLNFDGFETVDEQFAYAESWVASQAQIVKGALYIGEKPISHYAKNRLNGAESRKLSKRIRKVLNATHIQHGNSLDVTLKKVRNRNRVIEILNAYNEQGVETYLLTLQSVKIENGKKVNGLAPSTLDRKISELNMLINKHKLKYCYCSEISESGINHYHYLIPFDTLYWLIRNFCKDNKISFEGKKTNSYKCSHFNLAKYPNKSGELWTIRKFNS